MRGVLTDRLLVGDLAETEPAPDAQGDNNALLLGQLGDDPPQRGDLFVALELVQDVRRRRNDLVRSPFAWTGGAVAVSVSRAVGGSPGQVRTKVRVGAQRLRVSREADEHVVQHVPSFAGCCAV